MEIILKGSEKELSKFVKANRLHFKKKGILVVEKQDKPVQKRQSKKAKLEDKE